MDTYIKYVRSNLPSSFLQLVARVIHPEYRKYCPAVDRCFWLLTSVAGVLIEKTDSSINQINQALIERHVYAERSQDQNIQSEADQCTFCILGWLTLLYRPKYPHREITGFSIDTQASPSFSGDSQPLSQSSRPFLEIVGVFDAIEIFSKRQIGRDEKEVLSANPSATYLQPSHLGAAILTSIGRLSICWVDSLGSHLELDITNRKLFLFRLPSFVRLQATAGSLLPA